MENPMQTIIDILTEIIHIIENLGWSYRSIEKDIGELTGHIERLKRDDLSALRDLEILFAPTSLLQELSIDGGWAYQFLDLAKRFDHALDEIK
jgi:hypothetical protein